MMALEKDKLKREIERKNKLEEIKENKQKDAPENVSESFDAEINQRQVSNPYGVVVGSGRQKAHASFKENAEENKLSIHIIFICLGNTANEEIDQSRLKIVKMNQIMTIEGKVRGIGIF